MLRCHFHLYCDGKVIPDKDGTECADPADAWAHACEVASELMAHVEARTRHWQLEVCGEHGARLFELPFAEVDRTLDHLPIPMRAVVEQACRQRHALMELQSSARRTLREARALVARSRGKPYLAAENGALV